MARNLRALVTKNSMKDRYKTAQTYLMKIKFLIEDVSSAVSAVRFLPRSHPIPICSSTLQPQHALPDVFVWLIANGKRIAYHRFAARDLIYSMIEEESGIYCGKVQTVMLRLPGKAATAPNGWTVQAKLSLYVWLGAVQNKQFSYSGLPKGFNLSPEIRNAERPGALAPSNIHYLEKHVRCVLIALYS